MTSWCRNNGADVVEGASEGGGITSAREKGKPPEEVEVLGSVQALQALPQEKS